MDNFFFFFIHLERGRPLIGLHVTAPKKLTFYYYYVNYRESYGVVTGLCPCGVASFPNSVTTTRYDLLRESQGQVVWLW